MQVPASLSCLFEERIVHEYLLPAAIAIAGAILLILGSGLLVRGASGLVTRIGLSLEMIGVIVIALGATMPVLATSAIASYRGESGLAVGTIVGSNIFGVLFILGLSALLTPLTAAARLIRLDVPLVVLVSLAVLGLAWKGYIGRADGVGLVIAALAYVGWTAFLGRGETSPVREDLAQLVRSGPLQSPRSLIVQVILGVTGLGLILLGAYCLVRGVADLADLLKIDSRLAGLTALAIGASLPTLIAAIWFSARGRRHIALGTIIGSNILNSLAVLGIAALVASEMLKVPSAAIRFDIPVMIAASILCIPIICRGCVVTRWEGVLFLACYAAYFTYLVLQIVVPGTVKAFDKLVIMVVIPATIILVMIGILKVLRHRRPARPAKHRIRGI